jgi:two-component system, NtrC family, nitrogen regulation sensor histidine kinase NtrY
MPQDFDTNIHSSSIEQKPRRRSATWLLGGMVLLLLSVLVALQAFGLWSVIPPDSASDTLLLYALSSLNFIAFIVFAFIFVRSLLKLRRERKARQLGSKMKTRLVVHFIGISLLPITAMAVFSFLFVNRSIEKWFYKLPDETLTEVGKVQKEAVGNEERNLREMTALIAVLLDNPQVSPDSTLLDKLVQGADLAAIEVVSGEGQPLATSTNVASEQDRTELEKTLQLALESSGSHPTLADGRDFDAMTAKLADGRTIVIVPSRRSESNLNALITGYQTEYQKLVRRQRRVRLLGHSTLGLLTMLLLFAATWIAIHLARGIAIPIRVLAEASKEVARGNLSYRVSTIAEDELALLADSFNKMTAQLEENRGRIEANATELRDKNLALEERRNYIETVLESLSTGVISLGEGDRVTTINPAAAVMLRLGEIDRAVPVCLSQITCAEDYAILERLVRRARRIGRAMEQTELTRNGANEPEPLPVALTATALQPSEGKERGVVLVVEDMTELLSAQRAAAWSEVAKRMAHEIKNPLTPIQLSAERIAKNFHKSSNGSTESAAINGNSNAEQLRIAGIVDECTSTITREVAGLKAMVDEFSRFARLPHARLEPSDLNEVVKQAVALYQDRLDDVRLDVRLAKTLPAALLDVEQMRRVFVNLLENALEALDGVENDRWVTIATGVDPSRGLLLVEVRDTGHGIGRSDFPKLFQPYFSTRGRGTGLGLAIVQRIVADHGGRIRAESNRPTGAKFTLELPVHAQAG